MLSICTRSKILYLSCRYMYACRGVSRWRFNFIFIVYWRFSSLCRSFKIFKCNFYFSSIRKLFIKNIYTSFISSSSHQAHLHKNFHLSYRTIPCSTQFRHVFISLNLPDFIWPLKKGCEVQSILPLRHVFIKSHRSVESIFLLMLFTVEVWPLLIKHTVRDQY